ncbi:DUF3263 domain-containing protein [Luteococcus sp. Sow4_B9]|uniref:DUF3263 domain-containing protein n=1 Tax=Luteococcus sp. Sow4_B9 TaxID=3438792 RepID=UPI003F9EAA24
MPDALCDQTPSGLDQLELAVLDFAASRPATARSVREQEVRDLFGISLPRYHQLLNQVIDEPAALQRHPLLVKRLQRLRGQRAQARSAARLPG